MVKEGFFKGERLCEYCGINIGCPIQRGPLKFMASAGNNTDWMASSTPCLDIPARSKKKNKRTPLSSIIQVQKITNASTSSLVFTVGDIDARSKKKNFKVDHRAAVR